MKTDKAANKPDAPELLCAGHHYTLCGHKSRETRWIKITDDLGDDMDLRHLHLYSAAPKTAALNAELLAALKDAAEYIAATIGHRGGDIMENADAAIAKAEGK